jgi:hypothetical protein
MADKEGVFGMENLTVMVLLAGRWENIDAVKRHTVLSNKEGPATSRMELRKDAWMY